MTVIPTATIKRCGYTIKGTYHGGAYIDISFGNGPAFDVINVWDYTENKSTIPLTYEAVKKELIEWANAAGDSLEHDLRNYEESIRR